MRELRCDTTYDVSFLTAERR